MMTELGFWSPLIFTIVGHLIGGTIVWMLFKNKLYSSGEEKVQMATDRAMMTERLLNRDEEFDKLEKIHQNTASYNEKLVKENSILKSKVDQLQQELSSTRNLKEESQSLIQESHKELQKGFQALLEQILLKNFASFERNTNQIVKKFNTTYENNKEAQKEIISSLMEPIHHSFSKLQEKLGTVEQLEKSQLEKYIQIDETLHSLVNNQGMLQGETSDLLKALGKRISSRSRSF